MEGVHDRYSHVYVHKCGDNETKRPKAAAQKVENGMEDSTAGEETKQYLSEEWAGIGEEKDWCQQEEDWYVLKVILVSSVRCENNIN